MMPLHRTRNAFLIWLLPALLLFVTGATFGCYFETNDDVAISQVLRGQTAVAPITNLHLYFHGLSSVVGTLYRWLPAVPWYGLLLYALLYGTLVLVYRVVVEVLSSTLPWLALVGSLVVVYWFAWQETAVLMNFTRLPILLGGTGILYATQHSRRVRPLVIGLVAVALGWAIRPSAAVLGVLVALPGAWWLAGGRAVLPAGAAGILLAVATVLVRSNYSPVEQTYRTMDVHLATYWDYRLSTPRPVTAPDSLAVLALTHRAFADSTLLTDAFFTQRMPFEWPMFRDRMLRAKLSTSYQLFRQQYRWLIIYLLVVAAGLLLGDDRRQHGPFWTAQGAFALLLLGLTIGLKLPARLAGPLWSIWTLGTLLYVARQRPGMLRPYLAGQVVLGLAFGWYSYTLWHQSRGYRQQQNHNEAYLHRVYAVAKDRTLVVAGVEAAYGYLSPFTTYPLSDRPALTLMGWLALDPSVADLRQQLTGTRDFEASLLKLAATPNTCWLLQESFASYLQEYAQRHRPHSPTVLTLADEPAWSAPPGFARLYRARVVARSPPVLK